MAAHDRYDNDVLKALQRIANSLNRIERHISAMEITSTYDTDVNTPGTDA